MIFFHVQVNVFSEYKQKVDQVDRDEDDSIEYRVKTTWYFNAARSNGLTTEEEIIFPNILILSMVKMVMAEQPSVIGLVSEYSQNKDFIANTLRNIEISVLYLNSRHCARGVILVENAERSHGNCQIPSILFIFCTVYLTILVITISRRKGL